MKNPEILIFGGAIVDISLCPVDAGVFSRPSTPLERIPMSPGGDALNESLVLAALGNRVRLCSVIGEDAAGDFVLRRCAQAGIDTAAVTRSPEMDTGINVVLVDAAGERRFITSSTGSLRRFDLCHAEKALEHGEGIQIASFASIFVSPLFTPEKMATLFRQLKERGMTLCADMTRRKQGETVEDLACCLQYVDYLFPNESEAQAVTGERNPEAMADRLLAAGVKNVAIKTGASGCLLKNRDICLQVAGYPVPHCADTTGAGDTFAAGFLHALHLGLEPISCARFANACASICVEQVGATGAVREATAWERFRSLNGE